MDLYEILQVAEDATRAEIRAAYLVLVQESHPDRRHVAPDLAELARFKRIQEAFEILYDPARRAEYDRTRGRPVVQRGRVVVTPTGTGFRRDIPMHWLYRTGSSGRSKRRLGRWILLALVLAMLVAFISQRPHFFWRRLSSRAADVPPAARPAPRATQVAIAPAIAPADAPHQTVDMDPGDTPGEGPDRPPEEHDHAQTLVEESPVDPPLVDELLARSAWHPAMLDAAALPPAMYPPFVGELARFEAANHDPAVIVHTTWQVEDSASVLSAYSPLTPGVPLPHATVAALLDATDSHYLWNASFADAPEEMALVQWQLDDLSLLPLLDWPLADEMPIPMMGPPPSLGEAAPPYADAAMLFDPVDLGRSVNAAIQVELFPLPNASGQTRPVLNPKPYRQKSRATNKWETFSWSASQSHSLFESRAGASPTPRSHTFSRNSVDSLNWNSSGADRSATSNGIPHVHLPRGVSQTVVTWSTSPEKVDRPATGIRSGPVGLINAGHFDVAPLSPAPQVGESFYQRRELSPYNSP